MNALRDRLHGYRFEIQHIVVLFIIIVIFQTALTFINSQSTNQIFNQAMDYYRRDSAERVADLTTTALELLIEQSRNSLEVSGDIHKEQVIQSLDKLISQQTLQRNIDAVYLLVMVGDSIVALNEGAQIYDLYLGPGTDAGLGAAGNTHAAYDYFNDNKESIFAGEQITSSLEGDNTFHVLVPFYDQGEIAGAAYMRITPDVAGFLKLIESAYNQSGTLFTGLILMGFMAMFFIYSYTAKERDQVQNQLFEQRTDQLREQVEHQKESLFTKRIYHTHHKAEKVMGFIKEDLRSLRSDNLEDVRYRVTKYANFVSRVIYDMKSYDPPVHVIRNPIFRTNINEVIGFIVAHIFQRVYREGETHAVKVQLDLAEHIPVLHINEYVIWEILEPLIQNAIDHNVGKSLTLTIRTFLRDDHTLRVEIEDNGSGFEASLLEVDEDGVKGLFRESVSTKEGAQNSGYGCYLAREISRRCGWRLDAANGADGGACFIIEAKV